MTLVWDVRGIAPPFNTDDDRITSQLVWGCVLLDMNSIQNERAAAEYFYRAQFYSQFTVGDSDAKYFDGVTLADVVKRIGLRTNVNSQPRVVFQQRLAKLRAALCAQRAQRELHFQAGNLATTQGERSL